MPSTNHSRFTSFLEATKAEDPTSVESNRFKATALLVAMRPLHWVKNAFVLVPLVFTGRLLDPSALVLSASTFLLFCMASSAIYLINDVCDREEDLQHPSKRLRPITRGKVGVVQALLISGILGVVATTISAWLNLSSGAVVVGYLVLNVAYSTVLKRILIADVMVVAIGFVMRVLAGAYVLHVEATNWILLCTFGLALLIGFSKRRYEIMVDGSSIQFNRGYSPYLLDLLILLSAASVLSTYVVYVISRGSWQNGFALQASVLVVFYGVMRYIALVHRSEETLEHTQLILTDKPLMGSTLVWVGLLITEIYLYNPHLYHR